MKYPVFLTSLSVLVFLGAGCQNKQTPSVSLPPAVQELQKQQIPEVLKQKASDPVVVPTPTSTAVMLYRGSWFDVKYPQPFSAAPKTPTAIYNGQSIIQTDEATFNSPDGTVEFFVYSPLWSGEPKNYLTIAPTEVLVDEKTEEKADNGSTGGTKTHWVTVKAKDGSYYRSYVSVRREAFHHVFGIKYRDAAAYEAYKVAYASFKLSLKQYAD